MDGLLADLLAPWIDRPAERRELTSQLVAVLNRLGRIEDELHELHNDMVALAARAMEENR